MKNKIFFIAFLLLSILYSCQKQVNESAAVKIETFTAPFTATTWVVDTIITNPTESYLSLSDSGKIYYHNANIFNIGAQLKLSANGLASFSKADWDWAYKQWRLINNGEDIEITTNYGSKDTLQKWYIENNTFSYQSIIKTSSGSSVPAIACTYILR